jgi:hypothetical protein
LALHNVSSDIREVVVEGPSDLAILKYVVGALPLGWRLWAADQIEFDLFDENDGGARGRLIQLSIILDRRKIETILCVVDRDLDVVVSDLPENTALCPSIFANVPMHIFEPRRFIQYIDRLYGRSVDDEIMNSIFNVAKQLFAIRCLSFQASTPGGLPEVSKSLSAASGVVFDIEHFLTRMDSRNKTGHFWSEHKIDILDIVSMLSGDHRCYMNSHDLGELIVWALTSLYKIKDRGLSEGEWFSRALRADMGSVDISTDLFFTEFLRRLERGPVEEHRD